MEQKVTVKGEWTWRERSRESGLVVAEKQINNIFTSYGLTNLISGISGSNTPPIYLAVENTYTNLTLAAGSGVSTLTVGNDIMQTGDTQIYLSAGGANQEIVTVSSKSGSGPYNYILSSPTANAHTTASNDYVCRVPVLGDTMANVISELQYDAVSAPTQRMASPGGYSPGAGQWTVQIFYPGPTLVGVAMLCGLTDSLTIGTGNLHNHFLLATNHTNTNNDQEIDGVITLVNA